MDDREKIKDILTSHKLSLEIFETLCKSSIKQCKMRWLLSEFDDDPDLNNIYPGLQQIIANGRDGRYFPSICIKNIQSLNDIIVTCDGNNYDSVTLNWNMNQLKMFTDYIEENNISLF